jgi:Flp pilus assembly secretin CpaC
MKFFKLVLIHYIWLLALSSAVFAADGLQFVETADSKKSKDTRELVQWTHSRLVFNKPLERIAVGQEETLQVEVLSKNEALALAKKVGRTSVMVWYTDNTSETFLFTVTSDLSVLHHAIKDIHPNIKALESTLPMAMVCFPMFFVLVFFPAGQQISEIMKLLGDIL